jgi:imidazolonepropionase
VQSSVLVIKNAAQLVTSRSSGGKPRRGLDMASVDILSDAAIIARDGVITWLGATQALPPLDYGTDVIDATGKTVLPGLVDSHTHLIWSGAREGEFEQRLQGRTYQEIAAAGGGINATVNRVRHSSKEELKSLARQRLSRMLACGVTTVEVKSGYGLNLADEVKCLQAIAELNAEGPLELVPTFLGAHAVPHEYQNDAAGYVQLLIQDMLPEIVRQRLAEFCDVFCETGVFGLADSERILTRAADVGLKVKVHADELTPLGGAELAVRLGAASADHLLCISDGGIEALARSDTVATLLPGTAFFLGLPYAPARRLIERGVAVALASDCNPGTCPTENLPLIGVMACTQMKMLPAEALAAMTLNAAVALGRGARLGSLEVGKQADVVICDVPNYVQLFYHFGVNHVWRVIKRGRVVFSTAGGRW